MDNFQKKFQAGQSLVELLVAFGLTTLVLSALITGFVASREGVAQEEQRLLATQYARETEEVFRSVRESGWSNISTNGDFRIVASSTGWGLVGGSEEVDGFLREILIDSALRNSQGIIVESGGTTDPSTKKITFQVSWGENFINNVKNIYYFSRYLANNFFIQTSEADFNVGTLNNISVISDGGGAITIKSNNSALTYEEPFSAASSYTFDSAKIEVTGGFAQLKNIGTATSGSTTNSGFNTGSTGWTFVKSGNNINQTGNWVATGGNPGGYVNIDLPASKNKTTGGYWYQPITINADQVSATTTFQYRIFAFDPNRTSFQLYLFLDTTSATPVIGQEVWSSGEITGVGGWTATNTVNVSFKVTQAGTYYLKLFARVITPSATGRPPVGPFNVGFDNVQLVWSGKSQVYVTDEPRIQPAISFTDSNVTFWDSFIETAVKNGGEILYQLSDNDGTTWRYWDGAAWTVTASLTAYNTATVVNQRISNFSAATKKITFRAFLRSNGSQLVKLDNIQIGYSAAGQVSGNFISSTIDAGTNVGFNRITWTAQTSQNNEVKMQVATNSDNNTFEFHGPDGTMGTFYTLDNGAIALRDASGRYLKYKAFLSTTVAADKPKVFDVTINYSP
jgi:hypothetical protein